MRIGASIAGAACLALLGGTMTAAAGTSFPIFANGFECDLDAWGFTGPGGGSVGTPLVGSPYGTPSIRRYAGNCAMRAEASPSFVRDVSPVEESRYRARVYVYASLTSGEVVFLRAADASDATKLRVSYVGSGSVFRIYVGADATPDGTVSGVVQNRWYAVEVSFSNASPSEVRYTVHGAGSATPLANDVLATANPGATDVIDQIEIGWIQDLSAGVGTITFDDFVSTRDVAAIGRVCRGDADASGVLDVVDSIRMLREINLFALSPGSPDCNEDGSVNAADRVCLRQRILAEAACP
jgi:hypothetical protein